MNIKNLIQQTKDFVQNEMKNAESGHDWFHIQRVHKNAVKIAQNEDCNQFVVEMSSLLHDIADWKFTGDVKSGGQKAFQFLNSLNINDPEIIKQICQIVDGVSFKGSLSEQEIIGAQVKDEDMSIEGQIVQDADRLDAIGAIGIARCFSYGGFKNRTMYDPEQKPVLHETFEQYRNSQGHTINHFYEKLLLLKDRMHTKTGQGMAAKRHEFMLQYLDQFFTEWNCKD